MRPFGVVILAAGGSSRIGRPKQLLPYMGNAMVVHAAKVALASGAAEVIVVVGAQADEVRRRLRDVRVRVVLNCDWAEGMGSSIRCGVAALGSDTETAVISLCDQPRITAGHLRRLAEKASLIAASSYDGVLGAPSAFARELFPQLLLLEGDAGARDLIRNSGTPVEEVPFAEAIVDIDTPEDYERLVTSG